MFKRCSVTNAVINISFFDFVRFCVLSVCCKKKKSSRQCKPFPPKAAVTEEVSIIAYVRRNEKCIEFCDIYSGPTRNYLK